jgi:hypothetical protein
MLRSVSWEAFRLAGVREVSETKWRERKRELHTNLSPLPRCDAREKEIEGKEANLPELPRRVQGEEQTARTREYEAGSSRGRQRWTRRRRKEAEGPRQMRRSEKTGKQAGRERRMLWSDRRVHRSLGRRCTVAQSKGRTRNE